MDDRQRALLDALLETESPSGFEIRCQRVWIDHVAEIADDVETDAYGNAVAVYHGSESDGSDGSGPEIALAGHADEIGLIVRAVDEEGYLRLGSIGGADRTVSQGQRVRVHAADGPVPGVVGQTAIHLRDRDDDSVTDIDKQYVDVGADDEETARELIDVGDPITFATTVDDLAGTRLAARGLDNRIGIWAAAEGLRAAADAGIDATVYAVSTIQEEVGLKGARMVGFDLAPDAVLAIDVTHATDHPDAPREKAGRIALGDGPVVARGSANHPVLVDLARTAARDIGIDVQLDAAGSYTGTDADAFYTARGGVPALNIGLPNRYMHTPVEVIDTDDLTALAELLGAFAGHASEHDEFAVSI